jgi:VanZ family protein
MASTPAIPFSFSNSYRPANQCWPILFEAWLPILLFTVVFAVESTAKFGSNHTSAPLYSLFHSLFGSSIDPRWSEIHHAIRKIGHFSGYGLFSLVCFRGIRKSMPLLRNCQLTVQTQQSIGHGLAIAAVFLVASADEIHQTFLPNRTGCFADVLLDTAGAVVLQAVLFLSLQLLAYRRTMSLRLVPSATANLPVAA